jgi:hypothetical protein
MSDPFRSIDPLTFGEVDGIVIAETAPAPSVQGVPANIAIHVGRFERGPENVLTSVGKMGEINELFGAEKTTGYQELMNKKFGSLRLIRVVASDAAKAELELDDEDATASFKILAKYLGDYGNDIQVKVEEASSNLQEIASVTCVADVADNLDGKYFVLPTPTELVGFWYDVDDAGGSAPVDATVDRWVEITTVVTDDTAATVATKTRAVIDADAAFTAPAPSGAVITVTCVDYGAGIDDAGAKTSGFTVATSTDGVNNGVKITVKDVSDFAVLPEEVYDEVEVVGLDQTALSALFSSSMLIDVEVSDPVAVKNPAVIAFTSLAGGDDGTEADTDYEEALEAAAVAKAGNILWTDKYSDTIRQYIKLHLAETQDKMAVIALDSTSQTKSAAKAAALTLVLSNKDTEGRIIFAFNPVKTIIDGAIVETSPAGWVASIISNIGPNIDPAFAANTQYMQGATGLKYNLSRQDYIDLMRAGIAAFENDSDIGGMKLRSGIVTQTVNSSKITILRRRMADFYSNSVAFYLKNFQNGPNTKRDRDAVKANIVAFDDGLINTGILPSDNEVKTGKARLIDTESLNTDASIAAGYFKIKIRRRIYSSNRFIVLQIEIGESVVVTEGEE